MKGRKFSILIGSIGLNLLLFTYVVAFSSSHFQLYSVLVPSVLIGLTGYMTMVIIPCFAYLADVTLDKNFYLIRLSYFNAYSALAGVIAGFIGGRLIDSLSLEMFCLLGEGFAILSSVYAILRLSSASPEQLVKEQQRKEKGKEVRFGRRTPGIMKSETDAACWEQSCLQIKTLCASTFADLKRQPQAQ